MMNITKTLITSVLLIASMALFAQEPTTQMDSMKTAQYRAEIGLDMTVPDFDTKQIDAKVMGARLVGILEYIMENYHQSVYSRKLCQILKEQVESLEKLEFELKKIQIVGATKSGDEITLFFTSWTEKNGAKVKQTEMVFQFKNGVSSDSQAINESFSMMSRYVQRREELKNK